MDGYGGGYWNIKKGGAVLFVVRDKSPSMKQLRCGAFC